MTAAWTGDGDSPDVDEGELAPESSATALWNGDTGQLSENSRCSNW